MKQAVMEELQRQFRPEFLNRVDETIVFHSLTTDQLKAIVEIQLGRLRERLQDRQLNLDLTDAARGHIVAVGYNPNYGARSLKRAIQKEIENHLGRRILSGEICDGQSILVDYDPERSELTFAEQETQPVEAAETPS